MRICIVSEGSYPYVVGGVSSWIHQLITNMPEYEFIIISINPEREMKGKYKYELPSNLIKLHDIFLDEVFYINGKWNKKIRFFEEELASLKSLLKGENLDWKILFDFFSSKEMEKINAKDILMSEDFYEIVKESYTEKHSLASFEEVYWTLQSMYLVLFSLLSNDYPKADIYHSVSTGYAGIVGAYAAYENNKKFILTEHGIYTREREEEIIQADWVKGYIKNMWIDYFYNLSHGAYENAEKVISLFPRNRDIQIEIGCPEHKTQVIHNGISISKYEDIARQQREKPISKSIKVGAIIRVVPIKDIKTMLQAFALVNEEFKDIIFYIMGPTEEDPDYYNECLDYKNNLNLDNVIFTGMVKISEYLPLLDILVLTSISEGQPLAILEGMASGLPFVTTNVGDCGDLVYGTNDEYGQNGFVAPIMDYVKISQGILTLAKDGKMRKRFGEAGYNRVLNNYSFEKFIESYKAIYNEVCEG